MTYSPLGTPGTPAGLGDQGSQTGGTTSTAKNEAKDVGRQAAGGAKQVAGTAKDQAANVAGEAKYQARDLIGQARDEASQQTRVQQQRAAQGLRTVADHLNGMAQGSESGIAQQVVQNVSERAHTAASWLEQREPADLLDEVRTFASRRPGLFLAIAVGAGVVAGRLTKGLIAQAKSDQGSGATGSSGTTSTYGTTGTYGSTYGTSGADRVLPAYEPAQSGYSSTTTGASFEEPIAGPLTEDDELGSRSAYGEEYGRSVGNDRI